MVEIAQILDALRDRHLRVTPQRVAVIEAALGAADEHLTVDELTAIVQRTSPDVHSATVYRTLNELERCGIVHHVHLAHGSSIHHFSDHRPHHHAVCTRCRRVIEITDDELAALAGELREHHGFELDPRHFALTGHCVTCRPTRR